MLLWLCTWNKSGLAVALSLRTANWVEISFCLKSYGLEPNQMCGLGFQSIFDSLGNK